MTSSFEIRDCQQQINKLHARVFGPNGPAPTESAQPGESPLNDDEVLRLIHSSKQAKRFNALWEGSIEGYPSHSEADLGLCNILAFWCGRDPEQMDRLFRESNLWRKKWDERHGKDTYGNITIQEAIRKTTEVFTPRSDPTGDFDDPDSGQGGRRKKPTQAKILVELANEAELFHNADGVCYATVPMNGHLENWPIRSKPFRRWLSQKFYSTTGTPPGSQALSDAMNVIEGKAQFDGPEEETFIRLAKKKDSIYLDLADPQWRCVEISKDDWGVLDKPPVKFIRPKGLLPIPAPEKGGSLEDLRPFINCRDESDFRLLVSWLIQALNPDGPYPILILEGEQGSAKSTTSKALRSTIDPNLAPIRAVPRDERDLIIAATNGLVAAFDNLSGVPNWLSDALCRIATGGGIGTRELYTNGDEFIFEATRPQILNGIDQIASRHDLADRSIIL